MATIIHKVLFEKLAQHAEWEKFRETFRVVTGGAVELVEGKGKRTELVAAVDVRGIHIGSLVVKEGQPGSGAEAAAWRYLLAMAAERFSSILAESHIHDHERLPAAVLKTCAWIRDKALTEEVRLCEAAQACGISSSHLSRQFHRSTGLTFQNYVTRFRLEKAGELLARTNQSITEIAFESGFQSLSQFHRCFKAVYRERPRDYRRKRSRAGLEPVQ